MDEFDELILRESKPDKYGQHPDERSADSLLDFGIVNIDKPSGPTSHQTSYYVKRMLGIKKCGHSGTLDPKVTGVLPIAVGRATRVLQAMLPAGKEYVCVMHLHQDVAEARIRQLFKDFTGKIKQLPPVKSAVKRKERVRAIYSLELIEINDKDVLFRVGCQAGTYIRKLCHDMGVNLGTGAHMAELRRTRAGSFDESTLCTLQDLADAFHYYKEGDDSGLKKVMVAPEKAVQHLRKVWALTSTVDNLCHGVTLKVPGIAKLNTGIEFNEVVAVMTLKDELIGLGSAKMSSNDIKKYSKGVALKLDHVFMKAGTYPRLE